MLPSHSKDSLMSSFIFLEFLLFCHVCLCGGHGHDWSYKEELGDGPSTWSKRYPICGGNFQSPVDIRKTEDSGNLTSLILEGYEKVLTNAVLVNNGHSVQLSSSDFHASLSGGCLGTDKYDFVQLHFHWGSNDSVGSEHKVMGRRFPMEGHFVHRNRKYGSMEEARKQTDGFAVLGVFYRTASIKTNFLYALNKAVREASQEEINVKIKVDRSISLRKLMPEDMCRFYCYQRGSLTIPGCYEAVTWTLMEDTVPLSRKQVAEFRTLRFEDNTAMVNNFRPVQELGDRTIYFHGDPSFSTSDIHRSMQKCYNGKRV